MTTHIYENLAVLLRTCVPTFRTQRFVRNALYTAISPRRAHYTLQAAGILRGAALLAHDFGTKSSVLHLARGVHVPEMQKPHAQHLDGADMGFDASSVWPGTRN